MWTGTDADHNARKQKIQSQGLDLHGCVAVFSKMLEHPVSYKVIVIIESLSCSLGNIEVRKMIWAMQGFIFQIAERMKTTLPLPLAYFLFSLFVLQVPSLHRLLTDLVSFRFLECRYLKLLQFTQGSST